MPILNNNWPKTQRPVVFFLALYTTVTMIKQHLPKNWIVVNSKSYPDKIYYFNVKTSQSSWDQPTLEKSNKVFYYLWIEISILLSYLCNRVMKFFDIYNNMVMGLLKNLDMTLWLSICLLFSQELFLNFFISFLFWL